jgi:hypothetical protein
MQANPNSLPSYAPILFFFGFVAFWMAICFIISMATGWLALSRRFTRQSEPCGETRSAGPLFYSVYMRYWSHYGSVIRATAAQDGLYLSVLFPFRVGYPPLAIPWEEIEMGTATFFWRKYVQLTLGREERIPFRISKRMATELGVAEGIPGITAGSQIAMHR